MSLKSLTYLNKLIVYIRRVQEILWIYYKKYKSNPLEQICFDTITQSKKMNKSQLPNTHINTQTYNKSNTNKK